MKVVHLLPAATLLAAAAVIIAPACAVAQSTSWTVPDTVEVNGTTYVDCRAVSGYPFAVAGDLRTLRGKVTTEMGTRSFPWICNAVEGLLLFRASDGAAIYDPQFDGHVLQVRAVGADRPDRVGREPGTESAATSKYFRPRHPLRTAGSNASSTSAGVTPR